MAHYDIDGEKFIKVQYWEKGWDRYGDRIDDLITDWVPEMRLPSLQNDKNITELVVLED